MLLHLIQLVILADVLLLYNGQVGHDPINITRQEGEENVLIHCPFSANGAPIWKVNQTLYEPLGFKPPIQPTITGISITKLTRDLNQTSFQCFILNGVEELAVQASSVGWLTVTKNDGLTPSSPTKPSAEIVLDHQKLITNATHTTIGWKFYNQSCSALVTFEVQLYLCNSSRPFKKWPTSRLHKTLQSSVFGNSYSESFVTISALNYDGSECTTMAAWFQIKPEMLVPNIHSGGLGDPKICIDVPTTPPLKSLYVVWPGDADTDCICPLCDSADCVWNNCQYSKPSFIVSPELHVDTTTLNGIKNSVYSLCWPHLQIEMNNTAIHFFYEERSCIGSINQVLPSFLSRTFIRVDKIILYGLPLAPTVKFTPYNICFNSLSFYPIEYYIVTITDILNSSLTIDHRSACIARSADLLPRNCSPFHLLVTAQNKLGSSNSSNWTTPDNGGNYCSCIQEKTGATITKNVTLEFKCSRVQSIVEGVIIKATILHQYPDDEISLSVNISQICQIQSIVSNGNIQNQLKVNQQYNVKLVWSVLRLSSPIVCDMGNDYTLTQNKFMTVGVPVLVSTTTTTTTIILITLVIIVCLYIYKRQRCQCRLCTPRQTSESETCELVEGREDRELTPLSERHYNSLCTALRNHASQWKTIGQHLGFLPGELENIQAKPGLFQEAPISWLNIMLHTWLQWAPGDSRGSKNFATLGALCSALRKSGLGATAQTLHITNTGC